MEYWETMENQVANQISNLHSLGDRPEPVYCKYCDAELQFEPLAFLDRIKWIGPKGCDCKEAVEEREEEKLMIIDRQKATEAAERIARIEKLFQTSNLGERFRNRTFGNFKPRNKLQEEALDITYDYAMKFAEYRKVGQGLFFTGTPGTGKTHLAAAVCHHLINSPKPIPVLFGNVTSLLGRIKQTYDTDSDESEQEILRELVGVPLLVIDDLGKEYVKRDKYGWSWVHQKLYEVINNRYEDNKPLIVTTNLTLKELEDRMDQAIVSRIIEMCRGVRCEWEDQRKFIAVSRSKGANN